MTYEQYCDVYEMYNKKLDILHDKLNSFDKLPDGRITDEAMRSEEYRDIKKMYDFFFRLFRNLNGENKEHSKRRSMERRFAKKGA